MITSRADALRVGQRLASAVCSANVIVIEPGCATEVPWCGGEPMKPGALLACSEPDWPGAGSARTVAGVLYWDEATGLKLACTRSGSSELSVAGRGMVQTKPVLLVARDGRMKERRSG
jgi:hypothetical protein